MPTLVNLIRYSPGEVSPEESAVKRASNNELAVLFMDPITLNDTAMGEACDENDKETGPEEL